MADNLKSTYDLDTETNKEELPSDTDFNPSIIRQEVSLHSEKLGTRPRPAEVPTLPLLVSVDNLEAEYLKNLYLAHFPQSKSLNINWDELLLKAKQLENTKIPSLPIDDATLKTFAELITRAIKMFKTPRTESTIKERGFHVIKKERIFPVILKCSSILLKFASESFDQLVLELKRRDIMDNEDIWQDFILWATIMYKKVNIEDPIKEAYLKDDIFYFILKCCKIINDYKTLDFIDALDIANEILNLIVNEVNEAYKEVEKSDPSDEKIQKWKDVEKKLTDAEVKYNTLYTNFVMSIEHDNEDLAQGAELINKLDIIKNTIDTLLAKIPNNRHPPSGSPATNRAQRILARSKLRFPGMNSGGITKRKKYRRYNKRKTKHYKKKSKRYTKKRNMRY
jgi:hypothetical protein